MQQRTIWIIAGVVGIVLACACVAAGAGGFLLFRSQQQQVANTFSTIEAGLETAAALPPPANAPASDDATAAPLPTLEEDAPTASTSSAATPIPLATGAPAGSSTPAEPVALPGGPPPDFGAALLPAARGELARFPDATLYQINARLNPDQRQISGAQVVRVFNTEDVPLNEIYFRLYPNAAFYGEGDLGVQDVQIDGVAAQTTLEVDDTALKLTLPQPLAPGQDATVSMRFTTTVPTSGGYGIFRFADGIFSLYNWHPELAVYENGGWLLNPVTSQGDPTNTDAANYSVAFAAPDGYEVVTSGVEAEPASADGFVTYQVVSALTRNFVVVASDRFTSASQKAGDVTINSYYLPADEQGGKEALRVAAESMDVFGAQFGAYPFPEMDVLEVQLGGGAAGMESTGLIMLGTDYYGPEQANMMQGLGGLVPGADKVSVLSFITAHETAHQWWYGVLGSDAYKEPWLDESLTNWSAAFFFDKTAGEQAGLLARDLFIGLPYRSMLAQGDEKLDQSVDKFSESEYSAIVYGKGALMYDALRKQIGDEQFFAFLRRYYAEHEFGRADGQAWRATLAEVIGEQQAAAFYAKWVEGNSITASDLPPGGPVSDVLGNMEQLIPTPER